MVFGPPFSKAPLLGDLFADPSCFGLFFFDTFLRSSRQRLGLGSGRMVGFGWMGLRARPGMPGIARGWAGTIGRILRVEGNGF